MGLSGGLVSSSYEWWFSVQGKRRELRGKDAYGTGILAPHHIPLAACGKCREGDRTLERLGLAKDAGIRLAVTRSVQGCRWKTTWVGRKGSFSLGPGRSTFKLCKWSGNLLENAPTVSIIVLVTGIQDGQDAPHHESHHLK